MVEINKLFSKLTSKFKIKYLLILKDDSPHAEVEHGANVEDEEEATDDTECEDGSSGWTCVDLGHVGKDLLTCPWPVDSIQFVISHWKQNKIIFNKSDSKVVEFYILAVASKVTLRFYLFQCFTIKKAVKL